MNEKAAALLARARRLHAQCQALAGVVEPTPSSKRLLRRLTTATTGVDRSYEAACTGAWGDSFLLHISAAARHARRAHHILQDLTHLQFANISDTRELILEARASAAILTASRRTIVGKRRERSRAPVC